MAKSPGKGAIIKAMLIAAGTVALVLGILGIFLPLLPATPFLLLAAACYARSSDRFYRWLIDHRWLGPYIRNYREGKGIPLRIKAGTITLLWGTVLLSVFLTVTILWLRIVLLGIATGVTIHIISSGKKEHKMTV